MHAPRCGGNARVHLVASLLSYGTAVSSDYSQKSVAELIDDLTQIDSESVAIHK